MGHCMSMLYYICEYILNIYRCVENTTHMSSHAGAAPGSHSMDHAPTKVLLGNACTQNQVGGAGARGGLKCAA